LSTLFLPSTFGERPSTRTGGPQQPRQWWRLLGSGQRLYRRQRGQGGTGRARARFAYWEAGWDWIAAQRQHRVRP